jgi:Cytochrome c, mono- and diheme variants
MKIMRYSICVSLFLGFNLFFAGYALCDDYSKGKVIFRNNCVVCHQIESEGAPVSSYHTQYRPKDFTKSSAWTNLSEEKITFVLTRGQGVMRPVKLTAEDSKALINYMMNDLKKQSETSSIK